LLRRCKTVSKAAAGQWVTWRSTWLIGLVHICDLVVLVVAWTLSERRRFGATPSKALLWPKQTPSSRAELPHTQTCLRHSAWRGEIFAAGPDSLYADGPGGAPGAGPEFGAPGAEAPGTFDVQIRMSCSPSL